MTDNQETTPPIQPVENNPSSEVASQTAIPDNTALLLEIEKNKEQMLRLAAELENLRKRNAKEVDDANKYAISKFAKDLIEVLENLFRAEASINSEQLEHNNTVKQIFSGVELTKKSLIDTFEKYGIKRVDPMGTPFNHDFHQAIVEIPTSQHPVGTIVQVIQAGYIMHDRLLRPALVAVAKAE
jgi:molecular chaperone GrpE